MIGDTLTDIELQLHKDLGFIIINGTQIQFIVFIDGKETIRAVMPAKPTEISIWNLLLDNEIEIIRLQKELESTKEALNTAKMGVAQLQIKGF